MASCPPESEGMTAAEVRTTAPPHPGGSVLASSGARASSRGASSESPRGRPGALRGGDRGSVRRTPAGISEGLRGSVAQGILWSAGSVAPRKPPRQFAVLPAPSPGESEKQPAGLPKSPARRKEGDPHRLQPSGATGCHDPTRRRRPEGGGLISAGPIVEEERRDNGRSPAHQLAFVPPATF